MKRFIVVSRLVFQQRLKSAHPRECGGERRADIPRTRRAARLGDKDRHAHAEQRYQQAYDREAAGKHFGRLPHFEGDYADVALNRA
jgi:hypothetical protein